MVQTLIINTALDKNNLEYAKNIQNSINEGKIVHYSSITKKHLHSPAKIIISGGPLTDKQAVSKELQYFKWIKTLNKPILGICCGHQIIGELFGSKIIHGTEKEIGKYHIYINQRDNILKYVRSNFTAYEFHSDSITLPKEFSLLAHSNKCRVEIMKHKEKPIYGVEFHPEEKKPHSRFLNNFLNL